MIIQCINCNRTFDVDSSLIPTEGRNLQCGSCNHTWFYKNIEKTLNEETTNFEIEKKTESLKKVQITENNKKEINPQDKKFISENKLEKEKRNITKRKKTIFSLGNILSYLIVIIISFLAIIVMLDTFKSELSNIFPGLEILLYNFFETVKDIFLFLKNLLN
tara:strand:- start:707 stop:1192 length:486 start_codon:yes stop_codon:yes gene_type:complete